MLKLQLHSSGRSKNENHIAQDLAYGIEGTRANCKDGVAKKGLCWYELKHSGMVQWGTSQLLSDGWSEEENSLVRCPVKKKDGEAVTTEPPITQEIKKRRVIKKDELMTPKERWSKVRYELAQQHMFDVLKAEGAVYGKPISRKDLRVAARKRIGDTGLLDHLLKHIDGKIAPGGTERFRRWHNTNGVMEYWLESADLDGIRREAGVRDPYWIPPAGWMPGDGQQLDPIAIKELKLVKEEMAKMKSEILELVFKKLKEQQANVMEETRKELSRWTDKTEQCLLDIKCSVSSIEDMCKNLMTWKAKVEEQLTDISNSLASIQGTKDCSSHSPADGWGDLLENTNLDNIKMPDFAPWWEGSGLSNAGQETVVQTDLLTFVPELLKTDNSHSVSPSCIRNLKILQEEVAKIKRDLRELAPRKEEYQSNGTPDSVVTANSKLDHDNSSSLIQDRRLTTWKTGK